MIWNLDLDFEFQQDDDTSRPTLSSLEDNESCSDNNWLQLPCNWQISSVLQVKYPLLVYICSFVAIVIFILVQVRQAISQLLRL